MKHHLFPRYLKKYSLILLSLLGIVSFAKGSGHSQFPVSASIQKEAQTCGQKIKDAIDRKVFSEIDARRCPLSAKLMHWLQYTAPQATFHEIREFMEKNPQWPLQQTLQHYAEEAISEDLSPKEKENLLLWFQKHSPLSARGFITYAQLLLEKGKKKEAKSLLRKAWLEQVLDDQKSLLQAHKSLLTQLDHFERCEFLLLQSKFDLVKALLPELTTHHRQIIQARLDIAQGNKKPDEVLGDLSPTPHEQSGIFYERIQWHCAQEDNDQAIALLTSFPKISHINYSPFLWKPRNLITRRLLEAKQYQEAYDLVKDHGLTKGEDFANAEWLAGWLSLAFLKNPLQAKKHFEKLYNNVTSPISRSRGAFWLGECETALKNSEKAKAWYQKAMTYPTAFYGQLAASRLKRKLDTLVFSSPKLSKSFTDNTLVQVIQLLHVLKCPTTTMDPFFTALAEQFKDPQGQGLLVEFAAHAHSTYAGVWVAVKTTKTHFPLVNAAYPLLKSHHKISMPALAHAIIIRESRFNTKAQSSAGATGMMQLMPETAKRTIKKFHLKSGSLLDPDHNVQVGTKHLEELYESYNGNLILLCIAYDAGPVVDQWIHDFGDPRDPQINILNWIETIPYAETRNYVQRVLESYMVYRKRLGLPVVDLLDLLKGKTPENS